MIDIEIEDEAWVAAAPQAQDLVQSAAAAALQQAEFDGDDGRIGRPHHPVCLSMPESLKAKLSRCPACGHMEGSHMNVTAFDASTGKIRATHAACSCGCKYYLTPRGVG